MSAPQIAAPPARHRRRIKLILPGLQFRLIGFAGAVASLALGLQYLLFSRLLGRLAADLPRDNLLVLERGSSALLEALGVSALILFPLVLWIGIQTTFRIAGPLFRMKRFLEQVARGEKPEDCRLRKGDQLHDFCAAINAATRPMRAATSEPTEKQTALASESAGQGRREAA